MSGKFEREKKLCVEYAMVIRLTEGDSLEGQFEDIETQDLEWPAETRPESKVVKQKIQSDQQVLMS